MAVPGPHALGGELFSHSRCVFHYFILRRGTLLAAAPCPSLVKLLGTMRTVNLRGKGPGYIPSSLGLNRKLLYTADCMCSSGRRGMLTEIIYSEAARITYCRCT